MKVQLNKRRKHGGLASTCLLGAKFMLMDDMIGYFESQEEEESQEQHKQNLLQCQWNCLIMMLLLIIAWLILGLSGPQSIRADVLVL